MPDPDQGLARFTARVAAVAGDSGSRSARKLWRALGDAGVIGELYAETDLGPGPTVIPARLAALLRTLDERLPLGLVLSICVQAATVVPLLAKDARGGSGASVHRAMLDGSVVVALAVTDAVGPGSDVVGGGTDLKADPLGTLRLTGTKRWITNSLGADYALVLARHRPARHFTSFRWVLVPLDAAGVEVSPAAELFADAGVGHLTFDRTPIGDAELAGPPGRGFSSFSRHVGVERYAGAVWAHALCRRVLRDTLALLRADRGAVPLWEDSSIRYRFARCVVELERMRAMTEVLTRSTAAGMVLKASVAQGVETILGECLQLSGAEAFRPGGVAELRAEAAMFGIAGGAAGAMLAGVAGYVDDLLADAR